MFSPMECGQNNEQYHLPTQTGTAALHSRSPILIIWLQPRRQGRCPYQANSTFLLANAALPCASAPRTFLCSPAGGQVFGLFSAFPCGTHGCILLLVRASSRKCMPSPEYIVRRGVAGLQDVCIFNLSFPGGSQGKESACNAGDTGSVSGLGRSPAEGNGNPLQQSGLENLHGQRSLAGYSLWGCKESDMTEQVTLSL